MRAVLAGAALISLSILSASCQTAVCKQASSVQQVQRNLEQYNRGFAAVVHGWVEGYKPQESSNVSKAYILKDENTYTVDVYTARDLPKIGDEVCVTATVNVDPRVPAGFYLVERERQAFGPDWRMIVLYALGATLVVLALLIAWSFFGGAEEPTPPPLPKPGLGEDVSFIDIPTRKMEAGAAGYDPDTVRALPGRLVHIENGQVRRVYPLVDQFRTGEVPVGRKGRNAVAGVAIEDPTATLSRHQATISYSPRDRRFRLLNLAPQDKNPTVLNGRALAPNEASDLDDGATLVMGAVELRFERLPD